MISTIHKKSESEETDLFMSFESYLQMDLWLFDITLIPAKIPST